MKKIISLLLALTCAVALFACGQSPCETCVDADKNAICDVCGNAVNCETCVDADKNAICDVCGKDVACAACVDADRNGACDVCGRVVAVNAFEDFEAAISATDPAGFVGTITLDTAAGEMKGEYTASIAADGAVTVNYSFDSFNSINNGGAGDVSSKKEGTVVRNADGTYSGDGFTAAESVAGVVTSIKLDKALMNYNVAGGTLSATVVSANTAEVLGTELASDATFILIINSGKVVSLALSYEVEGADVSIVCEYK